MRKIINDLKTQADHRENMIGTTAPSNWLKNKTQEDWDEKEKYEIKQLRKAANILTEKTFKNADIKPDNCVLLDTDWLDVSTVPDYFSFRCLIKFEEFGIEGPDKNHVSTGYWWHKDNCFTIDNVGMKNMTPKEFIPLYDNFS